MEQDQWLVGWREIGGYIKRSGRTAQRWGHDGMPFFRDPAGRPIAKPSLIDEYILDLNRGDFHHGKKPWQDDGIDNAISYVEEKEKARKDVDKEFIEAQRPTRGRF